MVQTFRYFISSLIATVAMVYYAYHTQRQFYPTILYLVSSKLSFVVVGNMLLATIWILASIFKSIYFGQLREAEGILNTSSERFVILIKYLTFS